MAQSEQFQQCNRKIEKSKNRKILFTLKAWPVIAFATIGLCFLTQLVAECLGIELPEQTNIDVVRRCFATAFDSAKHFGVAAFLVAQVVVILPVLEELVFRGFLYRLAGRMISRAFAFRGLELTLAAVSSALFSAAHYLTQPWPDNAFLALFFFGLAQCGLYRKTGRLTCAMLNHALFNLTNLALLPILG